jgi:hypothetical protein
MTGEEENGGKQIRRISENNNTNGDALMLGNTHTL